MWAGMKSPASRCRAWIPAPSAASATPPAPPAGRSRWWTGGRWPGRRAKRPLRRECPRSITICFFGATASPAIPGLRLLPRSGLPIRSGPTAGSAMCCPIPQWPSLPARSRRPGTRGRGTDATLHRETHAPAAARGRAARGLRRGWFPRSRRPPAGRTGCGRCNDRPQ